MLKVNKKASETPLQLLDRLRIQQPELKDEKLSYAGRLDPMAEGEMLVLVGEENKDYKKHLGYEKEYLATFIVGMKTDTGDALGKITETASENLENLEKQIEGLRDVKKQKYPWFSSKTIDGIKLFDHFKKGNIDIERPTREVEIKEIKLLFNKKEELEKIKKYIFETIQKVEGDFRQKEILDIWREYFDKNKEDIQVFEVRLRVSSGTYIRALTEEFDLPVTLLKLNRTEIFCTI